MSDIIIIIVVAAVILLETSMLWYYLVVLLLTGILSGAFVGLCGGFAVKRFATISK